MSFDARIGEAAQADLERLLDFLAPVNYPAAVGARAAIERGYAFLSEMPFACRKVDDANPFLRELIIPFGDTGYVALYEIDDNHTVTILAVRHQREDDYH